MLWLERRSLFVVLPQPIESREPKSRLWISFRSDWLCVDLNYDTFMTLAVLDGREFLAHGR
jgi:hypothetical protein